jgi:hypothetical protein
VDRAHGDRALPNGTGNTFDRPVPDVSGGEHPAHTCLERQWRPWTRPRQLRDVATGQDEPTPVELHNVAKPTGVWFGADKHEHGCCRHLLLATSAEILQCESFEVTCAAAVDDTRAQPHIEV